MDLLSAQTLAVMHELEQQSAKDRTDGTPFFDRLRSVTPGWGSYFRSSSSRPIPRRSLSAELPAATPPFGSQVPPAQSEAG